MAANLASVSVKSLSKSSNSGVTSTASFTAGTKFPVEVTCPIKKYGLIANACRSMSAT